MPMIDTRLVRAASLIGVLCMPEQLKAQIRASEIGTVSQIIDGTRVTLEYSRPRSRGRTTLFGTKAVSWDEVWTPGANWATTLTVDRDVQLNGTPVPKGKYSVWMQVRRQGDWTTILEPKARLFHESPPDSSARQIRIRTLVDAVPFTDVLTWSFPELRVNGGMLAMQWERKRAVLDLTVTPSLRVTLPSADATAYVSSYRAQNTSPTDSSKFVFKVTYEDSTLKAQFEPNDDYMGKFALIRVGPDMFTAGLYDKQGRIYEVLRPDMIFTFLRKDGRVVGFEMRNEQDELDAKGVRTP